MTFLTSGVDVPELIFLGGGTALEQVPNTPTPRVLQAWAWAFSLMEPVQPM